MTDSFTLARLALSFAVLASISTPRSSPLMCFLSFSHLVWAFLVLISASGSGAASNPFLKALPVFSPAFAPVLSKSFRVRFSPSAEPSMFTKASPK